MTDRLDLDRVRYELDRLVGRRLAQPFDRAELAAYEQLLDLERRLLAGRN